MNLDTTVTILVVTMTTKQSGAVEACWAHNPEVGGSKPFSARFFFIDKTRL